MKEVTPFYKLKTNPILSKITCDMYNNTKDIIHTIINFIDDSKTYFFFKK